MANELPMHEGKVISLGGRKYVMPAMLFSTRKRIRAAEKAAADGMEVDSDDLMVAVLHETLRRNYADLTVEVMVKDASAEEIMSAYIELDLEEARRMAELGKRKLAQLKGLAMADHLATTTSSPPSSANSAEAGSSGSANSMSFG